MVEKYSEFDESCVAKLRLAEPSVTSYNIRYKENKSNKYGTFFKLTIHTYTSNICIHDTKILWYIKFSHTFMYTDRPYKINTMYYYA